jgi:predicted HNH restriction endonuclease
LNQFWVEPQPNAAARRIWIRYERCPGLPLLLGGPHDSLLQQLSVSRAQGTGAFRVTDEQWQQLIEAAGGIPEAADQPDVSSEFPEGLTEGGKKLVLHWKIERSPELTRRKKERVQRDMGCLACEVCGFDFASFYGPGGEGYIEVHHRRPLHTLTAVTVTTLEDLAVVCSNCHRMLQRLQHCSVETLRTEIVAVREIGSSSTADQG